MINSLPDIVVVPPLLAFATAAAVIGLFKLSPYGTLVLDHPNPRSLHVSPTPRWGGVGILAGILAGAIYAAPAFDPRLVIAYVMLAAISWLDDLRGVAVRWRIALHLASAAIAMAALLYQEYGLVLTVVGVLATTWMINLYNFMDGSDGLAGGMAAFGFGSYGAAAMLSGDVAFAAFSFAIAAAALAFLLFNFPPARVFMGDAGAIPLGYLAAVIGLWGSLRGNWPLWFGGVVFSPFIVDASCTLLKRVVRGAPVWQAHREHYYQRLVKSGWGHRKTALAEYCVMATVVGVALLASRYGAVVQGCALAAVAFAYLTVIVALERKFAAHPEDHA